MELTLDTLRMHYDARLDAVIRDAAAGWTGGLPGELAAMVDPLIASKGKRLRPALVLASHLAHGGDGEAALPLAATVELIHHASLIHDDIEDMDEFRRDRPSAWRLLGVRQALNLGDLLLPAAVHLFLRSPAEPAIRLRVLERLTRELLRMVEGQMTEIAALHRAPGPPDDYERVCAGKTGALFRVCLAGAAELAGLEDPDALARLEALGTRLGVLFQERDDLLDITGRKEGRLALGDLLEGKPSLLTVLAGEHLEGAARDEFFALHRTPRPPKDEAMAGRMRELLFGHGVVALALERHAGRCDGFLQRLPDLVQPPLADLLADLVRYLAVTPETEPPKP